MYRISKLNFTGMVILGTVIFTSPVLPAWANDMTAAINRPENELKADLDKDRAEKDHPQGQHLFPAEYKKTSGPFTTNNGAFTTNAGAWTTPGLLNPSQAKQLVDDSQDRENHRHHHKHVVVVQVMEPVAYPPPDPVDITVVIPEGFQSINFNNAQFYYKAGIFYVLHGQALLPVAPPEGIIVNALPPEAVRSWDQNGVNYIFRGITYSLVKDGYQVEKVFPQTLQ